MLEELTIWLPALGKKRPLLKRFKQSLQDICGGGSVVSSGLAQAGSIADLTDHWENAPPSDSEGFLPWARSFCQRNRVDWIIPTRDAEMPLWAQWAENLALGDIRILVCGAELVDTWSRKSTSAQWLDSVGMLHPGWFRRVASMPEGVPVLIAKPDRGAASQGIQIAREPREREALWENLPETHGVQPWIEGPEFTLNLYFDPRGDCRAVVPHERLETIDGEVSRGITTQDPDLLALGQAFAAKTHGKARGPLNVQAIRCARTQELYVTDINPRFGGGYPLTHKAGGCFTDWICREFFRNESVDTFAWRAGVEFVRTRADG